MNKGNHHQQNGETSIPAAYELSRSSDDQEGLMDSEYIDMHTAVTEQDSHTVGTAAHLSPLHNHVYSDATAAVHEMHLALLYLLSNPDEFSKACSSNYPQSTTTLAQWNAEYGDNESLFTNDDSLPTTTSPSSQTAHLPNDDSQPPPLPFVVFADDAEVVLPQAHTASQLFGIETITGMELEAAAGVPALSQLFLRWLGASLCVCFFLDLVVFVWYSVLSLDILSSFFSAKPSCRAATTST